MKYVILFVLLFVSQTSMAAVSWGGDRNINRIINFDDGSIFIVLEPMSPEPGPECGNDNWLLIPRDHPAFDQMYSTALAALHGGKKLNGYVEGCIEVRGTTYKHVKRLDALP